MNGTLWLLSVWITRGLENDAPPLVLVDRKIEKPDDPPLPAHMTYTVPSGPTRGIAPMLVRAMRNTRGA